MYGEKKKLDSLKYGPLNVSFFFFFFVRHFLGPGRERVHSQKIKKFFSQRSGHQMNLSSEGKDQLLFPLSSGSHGSKQMWYDFSFGLPESQGKCDAEEPVNSSIIWCLSCLIKHIIDYSITNDSHPITHESNGFVITTTWPRRGWTDLRYGGQRVSTVHGSSRLYSPSRVSERGSLLCQKQLEGKMQLLQDYHTASVWLFWLNSWIYMNPSRISIWNSRRLSPPRLRLAGGIFLFPESVFLQAD